jgi:NAD-dependent SIR2 family protein deacetylase
MSTVIFLIGAGASFDAGMPLVAQLTEELRDRLPDVHDVNGNTRSEFPALFEAIAHHDDEVTRNYERFFEWLALMGQVQREPFCRLACSRLEPRLVTAAAELAFTIKLPIWRILRSRHQRAAYQPSYLARLGDFVSNKGRLKVFTTNYDLCIEDACRSQGIDVITGFEPNTGQWSPSLFRKQAPGINLYKLHGSLNWCLSDDLEDLVNRPLVERYPPQWDKEPELLLGPGSKLQPDDPFVTLYSEFHRAIRRAKVCVAIGYSFRDIHIGEPLRVASHRGMTVVDVNPSPIDWNGTYSRYRKMRMGAKEAFECGEISTAIRVSNSGRRSRPERARATT